MENLRFIKIIYKKKPRFLVDPEGDYIIKDGKIVADEARKKTDKELDVLLKGNAYLKTRLKDIKDPDKKLYYAKVWLITEANDLTKLKNHSRRSFKGFHLDHIFPIAEGYKNNIPPEVIGNIKNLQFLARKSNLKKRDLITEKGEKIVKDLLNEMVPDKV